MQVRNLEKSHFQSARLDEQVACPNCNARAMLREDGTIICHAEGVAVIAEPGDRLFDRIGALIRPAKPATP